MPKSLYPVEQNIARHFAGTDSAFYLIDDEPLLRYLGVKAEIQRFKPTLYTSEDSLRELDKVRKEADAVNRSRISVLLANKEMDQTLTVTHTLWAMLGVLPKAAVQLPHRQQSVALDLILDCEPGCYTLVGTMISAKEALEHANAAEVHGEAGDTAILIGHAKAALEQVLEASIVAKGVAKTIWMLLLRSFKNQSNSLIWVILARLPYMLKQR